MERRAEPTPAPLLRGDRRYLRDLRPIFLAALPRFAVFFGTFCPAALASERPIAMACLRLLTIRPERPLFNVPALRCFIARSTVADAFLEYFRAMIVLPLA
jgi:hypothetical protein